MINVLVALPATIRDQVRGAIANRQLPKRVLRLLKDRVSDELIPYRTRRVGQVTYHGYDFMARDVAAIEEMVALFPGAVIVGAWDFETGIPVGMEADEDGDLVGTPTYPFLRAAYIAMRPLRPREDAQGNPLPGVAPTTTGDDHLWMGQAPRRFP